MSGPVVWMQPHPQPHLHFASSNPHTHHTSHRPAPLSTRSVNVRPRPSSQQASPFTSLSHSVCKMADVNTNDENNTSIVTNFATSQTTSRPPQSLPTTNSSRPAATAVSPSQLPQSHAQSSQAPLPFSKRPMKPNPLLDRASNRDSARDSRRELFLRRIQKDREDKRWEERSDEIMRLEALQYQRRWEAEQERRAVQLQSKWADRDDEDLDVGSFMSRLDLSNQTHDRLSIDSRPRRMQHDDGEMELEVERVARQEAEEMEALVALLEGWEGDQPNQQTQPAQQPGTENAPPLYSPSSHYGSDEDDYDGMFAEYLSQNSTAESQDRMVEDDGDIDSMDVS